MKIFVLLLLMGFSIQIASPTAWAERVLKGQVRLVGPTGDDDPAKGISVDLANYGRATVTDDTGTFVFDLPPNLTFGKPLTFQVQKNINNRPWRIWDPIDGQHPLPRSLFVTIKLLPRGSKKFWTDEFIEYHIAKIAEDAKREVSPATETSAEPPKLNFGGLIKEWAADYGFTPQEAKEQIDQWVEEVKEKQEDFYKLGLAAYAEQEFAKAAKLFTTYAERQAAEYRRLLAEGESHREQAIRGYRKAGDSFYGQYKFKQARAEYELARALIKKEKEPELLANVQMDIAGADWAIGIRTEGEQVHLYLTQAKQAYQQAEQIYAQLGHMQGWSAAQVGLGLTLNDLGIRRGGAEGQQLLAQAAAAYRAALEVRTREQLPQQWATTQNNLGNTLRDMGIRTGGAEGQQLLAQAAAAYRAALEVYTREQLPQQWATTQNNLGATLSDMGIRTGGAEGQQLLAQAAAAYRAALEVRTREQLPQDWAMTQNNLGITLSDMGIRTGGAEGQQLLAQAAAAYRAALEVRTREQLPQQWATTQNNLGATLSDMGIRTGGAEGQQLLAQAAAAYRAALEVRTREQLPQDWAMTQNNLGITLSDMGIRTGGAEGQQLLAQAAAAYRAALEVRTREQLPQDWAMTQNNLGATLRDMGIRTGGAEGQQLLAQAAAAYRAALEVRTREQLPQDWATTQNNLGNTLRDMGIRTGGAEGQQLLAQAAAAYRAALEVYTREQLPQQWATTQNNLGATLSDMGIRTGGAEGQQLLAQAAAAYRAALEVYTREQLPQDWAMTQNNLGATLSDMGIRTGGAEGQQLLAQAAAAYRAALEVRRKESLAPQWAQTHNNLAEASLALEDYEQVVTSYQNVLELYPDYQDAYLTTNSVLHEKLFRFEEAYTLNRHWLEAHPTDNTAAINFAETHLTTGRFEEAERRFTELLAAPELDVSHAIPLRLLKMAAVMGQQKGETVPQQLEKLKALLSTQPDDFQLDWSFVGTMHFLGEHENFATSGDWLVPLLEACSGNPRNQMLTALTHAQSQFLAAESAVR